MSCDKKNPFVIAVYLDNTLNNCEPAWDGITPTPYKEHVEVIRKLYKKGYIIIIHTARRWEYAPETIGWLISNRIPYHGIMMGKMPADYYIDDKNTTWNELVALT